MSSFASGYIKYVNHLEQINEAAISNPKKMISEVEDSYHEHIKTIANNIITHKNNVRICMLAGPSSSGKTTTANYLCKYLEELGKKAKLISLDDFYINPDKIPLRQDGTKDFETVNALNVNAVENCINDIVNGKPYTVPKFDFEIKKSLKGETYPFEENQIIVMEGLHGLNPIFTKNIDESSMVKLYVSVKQPIKDANGEMISHHDIRLIRRIVRDIKFRNTSAQETLSMWQGVMDGDDKYIRPYRLSADYTVNSIHLYEDCVLRNIAIPLLREIPSDSLYYRQARALEAKLMRFESIDVSLVPINSVLREFIGL